MWKGRKQSLNNFNSFQMTSLRKALKAFPLNVYKPTRTTYLHKVPRSQLLTDPKIKYSIYDRLPAFWKEDYETPDPNVHQDFKTGYLRPQFKGLWEEIEGTPKRVENIEVEIKFCKEAENGLWGGETIVHGYRYPKNGKKRRCNKWYWRPILLNKTMYSEILDRNITTTFTPRTLDLIDEAYGFDFFILKTHIKVLRKFGSGLKREMLLKLANHEQELYPKNKNMRETIFNKYKEYAIDSDRASWVGLSLQEAMMKQWNIEKEQGLHDPRPLLDVYTEQLISELKIGNISERDPPQSGVVFTGTNS